MPIPASTGGSRGFGLGAYRCHILKCLPGPRQNGGRAGHSFESPEDHIAVGRIIFDQSGKPPRLLRGDHGRPGTDERIEDDGAAPAAVPDGVGHEVDWLDRRVPFEVVETSFPETIDARGPLAVQPSRPAGAVSK